MEIFHKNDKTDQYNTIQNWFVNFNKLFSNLQFLASLHPVAVISTLVYHYHHQRSFEVVRICSSILKSREKFRRVKRFRSWIHKIIFIIDKNKKTKRVVWSTLSFPVYNFNPFSISKCNQTCVPLHEPW